MCFKVRILVNIKGGPLSLYLVITQIGQDYILQMGKPVEGFSLVHGNAFYD